MWYRIVLALVLSLWNVITSSTTTVAAAANDCLEAFPGNIFPSKDSIIDTKDGILVRLKLLQSSVSNVMVENN